MKFSNKNILPDDSKESIAEKINYNFNQIVSFSQGPDGRVGPKGPTGYSGAAGPKGASGATGNPPSYWYYSSTEPSLDVNEYDLWINSGGTASYEIYQYLSGSWSYTGLSLIESEFFAIRNSLPTSDTVTSDFKGIYTSGDDQSTTFFVISDSDLSAADINRNNSKLLISTNDQTTKPIFSIRKIGSDVSKSPAFYWSNTGSDSRIKYKSGYNFGVSTKGNSTFFLRSFRTISSNGATGSILMSGRNLNIRSSSLTLQYGSWPDNFDGSLKINAGRNFILNTPLFSIDQQTVRRNSGGWYSNGSFTLQPSASISQPEGINVVRGGTSNFPLVSLGRSQTNSENPAFSSIQNFLINNPFYTYTDAITGSTLQGIDSQVIFGPASPTIFSTGYPNAATGSFCYHVGGNFDTKGIVGQTTGGRPVTYFDLTDLSLFENETITISPSSSTLASATSFYVKIPAYQSIPHTSTIYPILDPTYISETRVILNYGTAAYASKQFAGIIYDKLSGYGSSPVQSFNQVQQFPTNCSYFDIMYYYNSSSQIMVYIKTAKGNCIPIAITDYYGPGITPPSSGGGGGFGS